LTQKKADIPT